MNREDDLDKELRDHVDLEAEDRTAAGLPPSEARMAAVRQLGSTAMIKEDIREARGTAWIERMRQDLAFAARLSTVRKSSAAWRGSGRNIPSSPGQT